MKPGSDDCTCTFAESCFGTGDVMCLDRHDQEAAGRDCLCPCSGSYPCSGCEDCEYPVD